MRERERDRGGGGRVGKEQKLTKQKAETDIFAIILGDFNTTFPVTDRTRRQEHQQGYRRFEQQDEIINSVQNVEYLFP